MPGDYFANAPRLTLEQFHALRDERPKEEKWELVAGVPVMMPPPRLVHQRIARNLETLLNEALPRVQPDWAADREIGILVPENLEYNPEPDVTVIDRDIGLDQIYAERFYFVCEVLSGSDKPSVIEAKLAFYCGHAHCHSVLLVEQDRIEATLLTRHESWRRVWLEGPDAILVLPVIGDIGPLGRLYRDTPLAGDRSPR